MTKRGLNCLLLSVNEIDLPVQKRGLIHKTRRPYEALDTRTYPVNTPLLKGQNLPAHVPVLGWGDPGEQKTPTWNSRTHYPQPRATTPKTRTSDHIMTRQCRSTNQVTLGITAQSPF